MGYLFCKTKRSIIFVNADKSVSLLLSRYVLVVFRYILYPRILPKVVLKMNVSAYVG